MPSPAAWERPPFPFVYEVNTWPWLDRLQRETGRPVDLTTVPASSWDDLASMGMDAVWLMGVWRRSPAGVALALQDPGLMASFREALPDVTPDDIAGSPYCVAGYVVDDALGGPEGLAAARAALAERGMGLILDYVPNHVAPDHPWVTAHPDWFVGGRDDELEANPRSFLEVAGRVLANGRDPFFAAWPDVVQLNAFSSELRSAVVETLRSIGDQCDGVRCDMAMLVMNDTFSRTWGGRSGDAPADDYWPTVIGEVRSTHPDMLFIAEAYWDLEWALQQQGFDHCYDKRLYDRLLREGPDAVRRHLEADDEYQRHLIRFVENHDEPRLAAVLEPDRAKATAVATLTQTGPRLVHDRQSEGWRMRLPVFLRRELDEPVDGPLRDFYSRLWSVLADETFRRGRWQLCQCTGWEGDDRAGNLVSWCWEGVTRWLVVVNLSPADASGEVRTPWPDLEGPHALVDDINGTCYERGGDVIGKGLYVQLGPWGWHLFRVEPTAS